MGFEKLKSIAMTLLIAVPAYGGGAAGSTGAAFLELQYAPRYAAMGDVGTAWADDAFGIQINPAGIARMERQRIQFAHNNRFLDLSDNLISYARPIGENSAWGASLLWVDLGTVERTTFPSVNAGLNLGEASASDLMISGSYARRLSGALAIGGTLKYIREELDAFDAQSFAFDVGILYHSPVEGLTFGASLLHVGTGLEFVREKTDLPFTLRLGAGYRAFDDRLGIAADMVWVKNQDAEAKIGGEYWAVKDVFAVRLGFNTANDLDDGLSLGLGVGSGRPGAPLAGFSFDYAYTPFGALGNVHQFGIGYEWGRTYDREPSRRFLVPRPRRTPERDRIPKDEASGAAVTPFEVDPSTPGITWWGNATREALADLLAERGVPINPSTSGAAWRVEGAYRATASGVSATVFLRGADGEVVDAIFLDGRADAPFDLWRQMADEIAGRIPGAVPMREPSPAHAPPHGTASSVRRLPEPVSHAPRRPSEVEVEPVEGSGMSQEAERLARALTDEIRRRLSERDLAVGPNAPVVVRAAFTVEGDGRVILWGRVLDAATGVPLRSISATGFASEVGALAEEVVRTVLLAVR